MDLIGEDCWNIILDYKTDLEETHKTRIYKHVLHSELLTKYANGHLFLKGRNGQPVTFVTWFEAYYMGGLPCVIEHISIISLWEQVENLYLEMEAFMGQDIILIANG